MLSLLDLEGIPRGTGSGSCNAGRTELLDPGVDIGDTQKSFAIYTSCAQTHADVVATGDDWNVISAAEQTQGLTSSKISQHTLQPHHSSERKYGTIDLIAVRRN